MYFHVHFQLQHCWCSGDLTETPVIIGGTPAVNGGVGGSLNTLCIYYLSFQINSTN